MASLMASFSRVVLDAIGWNCTTMRRRLESLHSGAGAAQSSESASCSVPPSPASSYLGSEDEDNWGHDTGANDPDASDADNSDSQTQLAAVSKLQSAHSLVLYHHIILNRIRRACLLGRTPGAASAFATLMDLLRLILDLGLAVQRVRRGGDDAGEEGARAIDDLRVAWGDTYADFVSYPTLHCWKNVKM
jgi:hypothetical protein